MQTFLPYDSFLQSARVLDMRRLGKQRVEVKQILNALSGASKGWVNHPATKMWRGHEWALALYGLITCNEWIFRGYKDSLAPWFRSQLDTLPETSEPSWMGGKIHSTHRQVLLHKDFAWYSKFGWHEQPKYEYLWPVT